MSCSRWEYDAEQRPGRNADRWHRVVVDVVVVRVPVAFESNEELVARGLSRCREHPFAYRRPDLIEPALTRSQVTRVEESAQLREFLIGEVLERVGHVTSVERPSLLPASSAAREPVRVGSVR
jgi:hypothetical protein